MLAALDDVGDVTPFREGRLFRRRFRRIEQKFEIVVAAIVIGG
jgi:hypothetical protein